MWSTLKKVEVDVGVEWLVVYMAAHGVDVVSPRPLSFRFAFYNELELPTVTLFSCHCE